MWNLSSFRKITSIKNNDDSRNKCEKFNICVYRNFSIYRSLLHESSHIPENTSKSSGTESIAAKWCEIPNSASIHFPQILSGRQNEKRQSEFNLAMTLLSIVIMHILCNVLRVVLGTLVVALVGKDPGWLALYLRAFRPL